MTTETNHVKAIKPGWRREKPKAFKIDYKFIAGCCLKTFKGYVQESFCLLLVARETLAGCVMFYCFLQIEYLIQLNSLCSFCYCCCCISSYQPPLCSSLPLRLENGSYQKALESPILVAPPLKAPMRTISRKEWSFQWKLCLLTTRSYFNPEVMTSTEFNSQ